jgi:hypothetical protein
VISTTVKQGPTTGATSAERIRAVFDSPDPWLNAGFAPDFLVPAQFYDLTRRRAALNGETRLVFAVLEDAVRCYVKNANATRRSQREAFEEAARWFDAAAGPHNPFSFGYICDVLGVDPDFLRTQIKRLGPRDLPTKQMRSVGRRQVVRPGRRSHHSTRQSRHLAHAMAH